ncbi:hypothetical protein, partial [Segatella hominis]|uniref:hypothetical protein n=1 Tax=Segatella hominis TaxID=2518605 RepID=UPI003AB373A8
HTKKDELRCSSSFFFASLKEITNIKKERNHPKHSTYSSVASYLKHQQVGVSYRKISKKILMQIIVL